jgi:hypothetical protein
VPPARDTDPVRRFGCVTAELKAMAGWLKQCGIRTVAMQSTGVYWIPLYDILEARGFANVISDLSGVTGFRVQQFEGIIPILYCSAAA